MMHAACQLLRHRQFKGLFLSQGCACMQVSEKLNTDNIPCSLITGAHAKSGHLAVQLSLCLMQNSLQFLRLGLTTGQGSLSLVVRLRWQEGRLVVGAKPAECIIGMALVM